MRLSFFIVRDAILPTPIQDTDPFEGQGAYGHTVRAASSDLAPIIGGRPEGARDGGASPLDERSPQKGRAGQTPVCPTLVAATFNDWGNARVLLELRGTGITLALFAERDQ